MSTDLLNRREVLSALAATAAVTAIPNAFAGVSPAPLNFLVVGDWGRNGDSNQREVAVQMGKAAEGLASQCVISVGDNFYEDGVQSTSDPMWRSSF
jgi:tartrate-resistant acid phosphatase type 5